MIVVPNLCGIQARLPHKGMTLFNVVETASLQFEYVFCKMLQVFSQRKYCARSNFSTFFFFQQASSLLSSQYNPNYSFSCWTCRDFTYFWSCLLFMQLTAHLETYLVAVQEDQADILADILISGNDQPAVPHTPALAQLPVVTLVQQRPSNAYSRKEMSLPNFLVRWNYQDFWNQKQSQCSRWVKNGII